MAKINTEKEDIKRYVNEANRRLGNNSVFHAVDIEKKEDQNYYLICKNGKHTISIRINSSSSMKKESTFCKHLYKKNGKGN